MRKFFLIIILTATSAGAQLPGRHYRRPVTVQEKSGSALTNYPTAFTFNTKDLVTAKKMRADGADIRFALACGGTLPLGYWIESGINTASTKIWVGVPSLPASGSVMIYMFYGDTAALPASTLSIFNGPFTSLSTLSGGSTNPNANAQRGWEFAPTEDVLITGFGVNVPDTVLRIVTVFSTVSMSAIAQDTVMPKTALWTFKNIAAPFWLSQANDYVMTEWGDVGSKYYFGITPQGGQHLKYIEERFCNSCSPSTYPATPLPAYQYGYVDLKYYLRPHATMEPVVTLGTEQPYLAATLVTSAGSDTVCTGSAVSLSATSGFSNYNFFRNGASVQNSATATYMPSSVSSGDKFKVAATDAGGCVDTSNTITLRFVSPPTGHFFAPDTVGARDSVRFRDSTAGATRWQWNFGDSAASGGGTSTKKNPVYVYTQAGTYTATLVVSIGGCSDTVRKTIVIVEAGDVNDAPLQAEPFSLVVYPNPTRGKIIIDAVFDRNDDAVLVITNAAGAQILKEESRHVEHYVKEVNMRSFAKGVYFIRLHSSQGTVVRNISVE